MLPYTGFVIWDWVMRDSEPKRTGISSEKNPGFVLFVAQSGQLFAQVWPPWHRSRVVIETGMVVLAPKWVRLAQNGTNPGLFQIRFQCIWRPGAKCTEIWSEKSPDLSHFGPIWPTLEPNLPSLTQSHPRSVTYYCITAFRYALSIRKINSTVGPLKYVYK